MNAHVARCPAVSFSVDRSVGELWTEFAAIAPAAHSFEDVCEPTYFGTFRTKFPKLAKPKDDGLRPGDFINVKAADNSWQARLVVRDVPEGLDQVHADVIWQVKFDAKDIPEGYSIDFRGPHRGHVITLNGEEIETGFVTAESARRRIDFYEATNKATQRVERARAKPTRRKRAAPKAEKTETAEEKQPEPEGV